MLPPQWAVRGLLGDAPGGMIFTSVSRTRRRGKTGWDRWRAAAQERAGRRPVTLAGVPVAMSHNEVGPMVSLSFYLGTNVPGPND
jgi:hypothetical protein